MSSDEETKPPEESEESTPSSEDSLDRRMREALPTPPGSTHAFFRREGRERPQPAPGLAVGKVVGDFRLLSLIGQGGMGQVWEAEQVSLRRRVAVKFVKPERVTERQLELFAREARAGGRLNHPGIVTIYGHGQSDGLAWIAMEFVDGAWTLRDFLDEAIRSEEVPEGYDRNVAHLIAEIADAMQAAHDAGVIHRDLKPQNILITSDDRPKVTDFGLARITDETALSVTGDFAGTYFYMSPEQVAARRAGIDHRTDVFSLGVVLYELLALRRPFEGDTSHQVAAQILAKDPPQIRTIRSRVPRDLAVITGKALEKDRDKRFQTMQEMAADLRRHLSNEPILSKPPTSFERVVKWARRNPARSAAAGIALLAFAIITLLLAENIKANQALRSKSSALEAKSIELEERRGEAERAAQESLKERRRADNAARSARGAKDEVLRLSSLQSLEDLSTEAEQLWPAHPENVGRITEWLARANDLAAELPHFQQVLDMFRQASEVLPVASRKTRPEEQLAFSDTVELRSIVSGSLASQEQTRWWRNQLEKLVHGIQGFIDDESGLLSEGTSPQYGWGMKKRLANAIALRDGFAPGGRYAQAWESALPAIRAAYPRLSLTPQLGLVPIGPDPLSKLWEFAHLETGDPAVRGAEGKLVLTEETGLVLVLLPGGTFQMGAQASDPNGPNYDPQADLDEGPVHPVTLSPFFLSKYEMTQAQWERFFGLNPSYYDSENYESRWNRSRKAWNALHPVEQVSWIDCERAMERLGLSLPSEEQWEYGARAGTSTPWWPGEDATLLAKAGNLSDAFAQANGGPYGLWESWDDGNTCHAEVGSYLPNPFGLHDVHGNVWEWCQNKYDQALQRRDIGEAPVSPQVSSHDRVSRGGSFFHGARFARSAVRDVVHSPTLASRALGLRPARPITP